jgi:hypothetical protein
MSCDKTASKHVEDKDVKSGMIKYGVKPDEVAKEEEEKHEDKD